jgi:hypothetical protein
VIGIEYGRQHVSRLKVKSGKLFTKRTCYSRRRFPQAIAIGILTYREKNLPDRALDPAEIEASVVQ